MRHYRTFTLMIKIIVVGLAVMIGVTGIRLHVFNLGSLWTADPYAILAVAGAMMGLLIVVLLTLVLRILLKQQASEQLAGNEGGYVSPEEPLRRTVNYDDPDELARVIAEIRDEQP